MFRVQKRILFVGFYEHNKKRIENTIAINYLIASKWNSFKPKQLSLYGIIALLEFIKLAIYNHES